MQELQSVSANFPLKRGKRQPASRNKIARSARAALRELPASALPAREYRGPEISVSKNLDEIDLKILSEIQADGRITNVELAKRVGISPPPCLRRVRTLEEEGYIQGYRGLLDPRRLGFDVTVFASVHLSSQAEADLRAFEDFVRTEPLVRECWMLSGEVDFILKCVAPDMATFQSFVTHLTAAPHVRNVRTSLVLQNSKYEAAVPLEVKARV
jgi:DNA-binding Lrp family transcriptional regulator